MITDLYLRFVDEAEALAVFGGVVVSDPVLSKEIAVSIAKDRQAQAFDEFIVKQKAGATSKGELAIGVEFEVDEKAPVTKDDVDLKVEDAVLKADWAPEALPIDGKVLGLQFDLIQVGTVWDSDGKPEPTFTPRTGHHVLARFRGETPVPDAIRAYQTDPWNQVIG